MLEIIQSGDPSDSRARTDLLGLYFKVFESELAHPNYNELLRRQNLIFLIAYWDAKPAGFKVGYSLPDETSILHSWIGGTASEFRRRGIAWHLMVEQHRLATEAALTAVETKCRPKWQAMLQLNYRAGFKLLREYRGQRCGQTKYHLRKDLM